MIIIHHYAYMAESFMVPSIPILLLLSFKMESRIIAEHTADHLKPTFPRLPYNYVQAYDQVLARGAGAKVHCAISKPCL